MSVPFFLYSAGAIAVGVLALYISRKSQRSKEHSISRELLRDIGIACLVAVIVSFIYELSTRNIARHETTVDTLNEAMSAFVPNDVWTEVTDQVMKRNFLRRNIQIKLRLFREGELEGGQKISLPPDRAVLWMSYGYDLYGLSAGSAKVSVQHELDYHMWDQSLSLPRFVRVIVSHPGQQSKTYEGDSLNKIYDKHGSINLDKEEIVSLPPPDRKVPVRITTERYEIVSIPGLYSIVMPQLVARTSGGNAQTITISIESLPDDIEPVVATFYGPHTFDRPDPNKNFWTYDSIMLPGQGFDIIFKMRSNQPTPTPTPCDTSAKTPAPST
jgi:hypothetical protein